MNISKSLKQTKRTTLLLGLYALSATCLAQHSSFWVSIAIHLMLLPYIIMTHRYRLDDMHRALLVAFLLNILGSTLIFILQ